MLAAEDRVEGPARIGKWTSIPSRLTIGSPRLAGCRPLGAHDSTTSSGGSSASGSTRGIVAPIASAVGLVTGTPSLPGG